MSYIGIIVVVLIVLTPIVAMELHARRKRRRDHCGGEGSDIYADAPASGFSFSEFFDGFSGGGGSFGGGGASGSYGDSSGGDSGGGDGGGGGGCD